MDAGLFAARVADTAALCSRTETPRYLGFLTPAEAAAAERQLHKTSCGIAFFGGYDAAERVFLACLPAWCEAPQFPIAALTVQYRPCDVLTHRDVLGALMSLGLKRETVGDILTEPGRAVVFVHVELADYITNQLQKIAAVGVAVTAGFAEPLLQTAQRTEKTVTVASLRLDCVAAALAGVSRKTAAEWIADAAVSVNGIPRQKGTVTVAAGDKISIRRHGKFVLDRADGYSKKGRIILHYGHYI